MHIDLANIFNLTQLWKKYGANELQQKTSLTNTYSSTIHINNGWPHRCWIERDTCSDDHAWLTKLEKSTILSVWPIFDGNKINPRITNQNPLETHLINHNWQCQLEQTAMYLPREKFSSSIIEQSQPHFIVKRINKIAEINLWVTIASKAFGYKIELSVIANLIDDPNMQFYLAYYNEQAVATGLLYKTENIIGVHQVGVSTEFQGKGIARLLMLELIYLCKTWGASSIVLQASKAGKPLYDKLGFKTQFLIRSYIKE